MSLISILGGDFEILFDDETVGGNAVAGLKMVRRASGAGATVYDTVTLYSAVADAVDDFIAMGFENPMLPVTPNAFTMENNYFMPRSSTEFLKGGAITANWGGGEVRSILYTDTVADFVAGDVGRQVIGGTTGDTGTILDFEVLPDGTKLLWIRPDDVATDLFDDASETLICTADGGTGSGTSTAVSTTGTQVFSSIQVIGAVPTNSEVYIIQDRFKMTDSLGAFQWWATDPSVSLAIIDILIRVQRDSVAIADGDVEVFSRKYTSLYDNFRLNVAAGGRSALPLASAPDINNTTGYRAAVWSGGTGSAMLVGDLLTNTSVTGSFAVVTAVVDSGATGTFEYYLVGELIDFVDTNTFTSPNRNGTINGAPTANLTGPTDPAAGEGGTVTIVLGTVTFDHDGVGGAEPYSVEIDAQTDVIAAKVYERIKYVTRRGAPNTDLFGAGVNVDGEVYRGLEAQIQYNTPSGTFNEGDDITGAGGYTARSMAVNTTDTYLTVMDQQTSLDAVVATDTLTDESSDTVIAEAPIEQIASVKSSPFGTFTGTQIFGARGILFSNPASADTQNYILTDDNGVLRQPPNTVSFTVNNTAAGDRVLVARDTGTAGIIDKDQFGGVATGVLNALTLTVTGTVDVEVPASGFVRVFDDGLQQEHRYVYDSRTTGASGVFTLRDVNEGSGITTASTTQIIDTTATFQSAPLVEVGMLVRNTFAGKTTHVWEVTNVVSTTTLDVVQLYGPGGATQDWDVGDTYSINRLIGDHTIPGNYSAADNLYDLLLDVEATGTSTFNTFVKTLAADFDVVVNVRQGKVILSFTQNQTVGDAGASVTVVRAPDTIAV